METNININQEFNNNKNKYDKNFMKEKIQNFNNQVQYKTKLLNIDSQYRNKIPKNIYSSDNIVIPNNPIETTKGTNIIKINYPNHKFNINDNIIIQNVLGKTRTCSNALYLFNNFQYMFLNFPNHGITIDSFNLVESYQIYIQIINDIGNRTLYNNIPINSVIGYFDILLPSILNNTVTIPLEIITALNATNVTELDADWLIIKLPFIFIILNVLYYIIPDVLKINLLSIGGVKLQFINADFPINYEKYQAFHEIINIDSSNIYIQVATIAGNNDKSGGNNIKIMLINTTINGYPDCNNYTITLKQTFNNVVRIELISSEFPYIDFLINSTGPNKNNKLYWKNYDDGNYIYEIEIPEGNYDSTSLISTISTILNSTPRYNSTVEDPFYNMINVKLDLFTQEITFISFKQNKLPNSLICSLVEINNIKYVKVTIYQPGNLLETNDTIEISGAIKIGSIIDASFINTSHNIYEVNLIDQTYSILLAQLNQITNLTEFSLTGNGGPGIIIITKTKASFLFDRSDTIGEILGFKNVGEKNAITPFLSITSNFNNYIQSTNLNQIGNIDNSKKILNFAGSNYYILMYLNNYECILNSFNQPTSFAKILMSGIPGDVMFNTFINYPLEFDFPIPSLNELSIKFTYPNGNLVDFRNINHSFTLRIIEKINIPYKTGINSKDTNFLDTFKDELELFNDKK